MRTGDCVPSDVYVGVIHSSILLGRVWLECKGKNIDILVMIYYYIRNVCYNQLVRNRFYKKKAFLCTDWTGKEAFFRRNNSRKSRRRLLSPPRSPLSLYCDTPFLRRVPAPPHGPAIDGSRVEKIIYDYAVSQRKSWKEKLRMDDKMKKGIRKIKDEVVQNNLEWILWRNQLNVWIDGAVKKQLCDIPWTGTTAERRRSVGLSGSL